MTQPRTRHTAGFTLLELLVVVSIIGLVMAIGTSTFYGVMAAWNERRVIAELDAQADVALESIRRDIADALSSEITGVSIQGTGGTVEDKRTYPPARHADDQLMVPVRAIDPNRPLAVPASIGYRVERSGEAGTLVRTVGPLGGGFPNTNRAEVIPTVRVLGFSVEFLADSGGELWKQEWTGASMPAAVRISLAIEHADRPADFQISRQRVFPVHVQ